MRSVQIGTIVKEGYCIGCGLCVSVLGNDKLSMSENSSGFLVPTAVGSQNVLYNRELCPGITVRQKKKKRGLERIYGPYRILEVGYSADDAVRFNASSGGVITGLLCFLLDNAYVDGVLHIGKDSLDPLKSVAYFSRTKAEVIDRCGSRYAPSSLLCSISEILGKGYKIAVVGKPCDIVGVRQYLEQYPEYNKQVVLLLSFMCMGIPSYAGTRKLVEKLGSKPGDIKDFWYRGKGWPGKATVIDKVGSVHSCSYNESWGEVLSPLLNFRCKICPDGYGEFADISSGDAWYLKDGGPDFEESAGRSIVFVRTGQGEDIYKKAVGAGYIKTGAYCVDELKLIQASQYLRKRVFSVRVLALKILGDRLIVFRGFNFFTHVFSSDFLVSVRNFLGMCKRRLKVSRSNIRSS